MSSEIITQTELWDEKIEQHQNPQQILSVEELSILNERSNFKGLVQLIGHLAIIGCSGYIWATNFGNWPLAIPALIIYGFSLACMFAPMHEAGHRTAFANNRLNDIVAWFAGVLSFYNSTFYRRYHKWHHRYTRVPGKDPELTDLTPRNLGEYFLLLSGLPWWLDKIQGHYCAALGKLDNCPFIPDTAKAEVIRSTRLQLAVYAGAIAVSFAVGKPWFFMYWLLPLIVGQPLLRFILLGEHTGCTLDANLLTNTRITFTLWPVQFLMWNMPLHAVHHLYPSIPFHAMPQAYPMLSSHFTHIDSGYIKVNRYILANLGKLPC
ncbi:fatty acid desaturase family protein [Tolypothrix sp. PCC 7910]|uniref:fatty acid desaturase family protein n=1 Tax=Tolypothrix sp. PCC 7910 TaxID=2099387 RepID=UPI0014279AD9|nr:fatty acid desaturase family protein [Tolypothrix sp. PCC 7910]QIR35494.1 fatty acid desaturase family protein [Tolypothrix sp. PCC 7910]